MEEAVRMEDGAGALLEADDDDEAAVDEDCTQNTVLQAPCERNLPKAFRRMKVFQPDQPVERTFRGCVGG